tara:strand:- start:100 stop:867 length:768 start_codon:yes stop_codon:yes gene_type:complete
MIELLNGERIEEKEILKLMEEDDFYYGYLGKNALSSSAAKMLLQSPKTYKYVTKYGSKESQALRDGWLFHAAILEPDVFESQHFVDAKTKAAKAYKLAEEQYGKVYTIAEKEKAERLADAFYKNEHAKELLIDTEFEKPAIGELHGLPFRAKADVLGKNSLVDLKTTMDIKSFPYSAKKYGYDVQAYIYCQLFKRDWKDVRFIAIDKGSLDIGIYDMSEEFYFAGEQKTEAACEIYRTFFEYGVDVNEYYLKGTL